jgi:hypothetical protein
MAFEFNIETLRKSILRKNRRSSGERIGETEGLGSRHFQIHGGEGASLQRSTEFRGGRAAALSFTPEKGERIFIFYFHRREACGAGALIVWVSLGAPSVRTGAG